MFRRREVATILLIDDNPLVRNSLMRHLSMAGHAVVPVNNGLEGIAALDRQAIDLIVTDIVMPDCDGIEFIRHVRGAGNNVPIIATSGGFSGALTELQDQAPVFLKGARIIGATRTLSKPFKPSALLELVQKCLGGASSVAQPVSADPN